MDIRFAFPQNQLVLWLLAGLAAVAVVAFALRRFEQRRRARLTRVVEAGLAPRLLPGYDERVRRPLAWLVIVGTSGLLLAMAQPRWGQSWVQVDQVSRDVLVLLDTSESMNAEDSPAGRLANARFKIASLMERMPGDRFGLIAFSGDAELQCPLTLDHGYFLAVLNAVDTDTLSEEGTNIAAALDTAVRTFSDEDEQTGGAAGRSRVILLLSDGEQVSGDAVDAAQNAAAYAPVFVIGIGNPEGAHVRFPEWMKQYVRVGGADTPHESKLDEETLKQAAVEGGGAYVRATANNSDVAYLLQQLSALEGHAVESELRYRMINRYRWPLAVAFACFFAEGVWISLMPWVRQWRMRRTAAPVESAEESAHA